MRDCVGLSVGATNLVAARADGGATVRPAAVTWHGTVLTGFVERFGDPVPIVAADGSAHPADRLVIEALTAVTRAHGAVSATSVAVPAHWAQPLVDRMRALLPNAMVTSDAVAALTALRSYPRLPARGVVALCDFGATGTTITLADAGADFRPIGEAVRYDDFSGDLVDRALLTHLLAGLDVDPSSTSAVASLTSFRDSVRNAKERLTFQTAVGLRGPRPGTTLRLTRAELEAVVREPLDGVLAALDDTLRRNGIWHADLAAVATVGGGARIPLVTQRLSEALRMPVTTTAHAQTAAAIGAALLGGREPETATRLAAAPKIRVTQAAAVEPVVASLAWSETPIEVNSEEDSFEDTGWARPDVVFEHTSEEAESQPAVRWYQRPALLFAAAACAAVVAAIGLVVSTDTKPANAASPMPTVSAAPTTSDAQVPAAPVGADAVAPPVVTETVIEGGTPRVRFRQAPPPQAPAPAPQDPPPAPVTTTPTPTTTETTTPTTTETTPTTTPTTTTPTSTTTSTSTPTSTSTSMTTPTSTSASPPPPLAFPPLPPLELPTLLPVEPPPAGH